MKNLGFCLRSWLAFSSAVGFCLSIYCLFGIGSLTWYVIPTQTYLALLGACFLPPVFFLFPASKRDPQSKVPWCDILLALVCLGGMLYVVSFGWDILMQGWGFKAPVHGVIVAIIMWIIMIEVARRVAGTVFSIFALVISLYPMFGRVLPGILECRPFTFDALAAYYYLGTGGIFGIGLDAVGTLLIGYMFFAIALQVCGGVDFFLNLAKVLMGQIRGGAAKISVVSSGLNAMISGSAVANVAADGGITIPLMIRTGYPPHLAAAIEACTSTGGPLTPPVMGVAAFLMAEFLNIPYVEVCGAAALPAFLYYWGLFLQVDYFAALKGMRRLPSEERPRGLFLNLLKQGLPLFIGVLFLIYFLVFLRLESIGPFVAVLAIFISSMFLKETRPAPKTFVLFLEESGKLMGQTVGILAPLGLIIGSLSVTGLGVAFSSSVISFSGGNKGILLALTALTSLILGMGLPASACYVFLAMIAAPPLIKFGVSPIAAHLFVLYWGVASFITPPVALAVYTAAPIAGSNPMRTGLTACRIGLFVFIVPFIFVLDEGLLLRGSGVGIAAGIASSVAAIPSLVSGMEGYMPGVGKIGSVPRILFATAALLLFYPIWESRCVGAMLGIVLFLTLRLRMNKVRSGQQQSGATENV